MYYETLEEVHIESNQARGLQPHQERDKQVSPGTQRPGIDLSISHENVNKFKDNHMKDIETIRRVSHGKQTITHVR